MRLICSNCTSKTKLPGNHHSLNYDKMVQLFQQYNQFDQTNLVIQGILPAILTNFPGKYIWTQLQLQKQQKPLSTAPVLLWLYKGKSKRNLLNVIVLCFPYSILHSINTSNIWCIYNQNQNWLSTKITKYNQNHIWLSTNGWTKWRNRK